MILEITENQAGERIDRFLADSQDLTRSFLQKILKEGEVIVNGKSVKANYKLRKGDRIKFEIPEAVEPDIVAEDIPLSILYEDADLIVVISQREWSCIRRRDITAGHLSMR